MIEITTPEELGHMDAGWLKARYHFSFADYMDPARMGIGPLRVWNHDRIAAGGGFPMHPHRDFEIVTVVRKGAVSHQDSMGNKGRITAGNVQIMSAGTGVTHSEFNAEDEELELFQIWVVPDRRGHEPRYEERTFDEALALGAFIPLVTNDPRHESALKIHQNVTLWAARPQAGGTVSLELPSGIGYGVVAGGAVELNGRTVAAGSGIRVDGERSLSFRANDAADIVIMELPKRS